MIDKKIPGKMLVGKYCKTTTTIRNRAGQEIAEGQICRIDRSVRGHGLYITHIPLNLQMNVVCIGGVSRQELELI